MFWSWFRGGAAACSRLGVVVLGAYHAIALFVRVTRGGVTQGVSWLCALSDSPDSIVARPRVSTRILG